MKKRIYLAMLAACLALTMTGCGESGKQGRIRQKHRRTQMEKLRRQGFPGWFLLIM